MKELAGHDARPLEYRAVEGGMQPILLGNENLDENMERLRVSLGMKSAQAAEAMLNVLGNSLLAKSSSELNALLAILHEIEPTNPLEILLASQMYLTHRRATIATQESVRSRLAEWQEKYANIALRFLRLYAQQLETLRKFRNGSSQTINVNYVNANQAVVNQGRER